MAKVFCYLVAVMDWATRKVLAWRLSNALDASFCVDALEEVSSSTLRYSITESKVIHISVIKALQNSRGQ
jgi:transposase InsO family protein